MCIPRYFPVECDESRFCQFMLLIMLSSMVLSREKGMKRVFCRLSFRAEYWENR